MATTDGLESIEDIDLIVDADAHVRESETDFVSYIGEPFRSMGVDEDIIRDYHGHYASSGLMNTPVVTGKNKTHAQEFTTPERIREANDLLHRDRVVVTPGGANLGLGMVHHSEMAAALASAYNEWLLDTVLDDDPDFYGAAVVAPHRPDAAAEEIDRRASEGAIAGVMVPSAGTSPPLGHERYHPIYEACQDHGLPVMFHNGASGIMGNFPHHWKGTDRYIDVHVPYHAAEHMFHLSTMLTKGVPVRFPDLKVVFMEAGLGWIPYFTRRYDHEYSIRREEAPMLEKRPSEYVDDQFWFTSQPIEGADDPEYLVNTIRAFNGSENLLFSSDYPHMDFDFTDQLFTALQSEFDREEIEAIYGGNAVEVFRF